MTVGESQTESVRRLHDETKQVLKEREDELQKFQNKLTKYFRSQQRELRKLANTKTSVSNPQAELTSPTTNDPLELFKAYLKKVYLRKKMRLSNFEELSLNRKLEPRDQSFKLVQSKNNTLEPIEITDIGKCTNYSTKLAHSILVEGAPGVGKSTFAWEMCQRWAKDMLFQEWSIVVLIDQNISEAQSLTELFYYPDCDSKQEMKEDILKELIHTKGNGMLFIFDDVNEKLTKSSVYQKIEVFSEATLLHLSRSNSQRYYDQHVKILGFTDDYTQDYIISASEGDDKLLSTLKSCCCHPVFSPLMSIPAECAVITDLYYLHWKHGDEGFSPNTRTEVYTDLVRILLLTYLNNCSKYSLEGPVLVKRFIDLPEKVYDQFVVLARMAAEGIRDGVYVFDIAQDETLGLMQRVEEVYPGRKSSELHTFLNLTLQEYMAAYYCGLNEKPIEELGRVLNEEVEDIVPRCRNPCVIDPPHDHLNVIDFTVGLTKLSHDIQLFLNCLKKSSGFDGIVLPLMHFLYETQSPDLVCLTFLFQNNPASNLGKYGLLEIPYSCTPADLFVIGYCIPHSNRSWLLNTTRSTFKCEYFEALAKGLDMSSDQCSSIGHIMVMKVDAEYVQWLPLLHPHTQKVTELNIQSKQGDHDLETLSKVSLFYPLLKTLTVAAQ